MNLQIGKLSTKDLAQWFGISYGTFRNNPNYYLEKLAHYCAFTKVYGGIIISEVYISTYDKKQDFKDKELYLQEIQECVKTQNGLSTVAGMSRKYTSSGHYDNFNTAQRRLTKAGTELFGKTDTFISHGEKGTREYIWAIKLDDNNHYRLMTEKEEERFDEILSTYYSSNADKVKKANLLLDRLKSKEISADEYIKGLERFDLGCFKDCIFKFQEETGFLIVRCTKHELVEFFEFDAPPLP